MQCPKKPDYQFVILDYEVYRSILQLKAHTLPAVKNGKMSRNYVLYVDVTALSPILSVQDWSKVLGQVLHTPLFEGHCVSSIYDTLDLTNFTGSIINDKIWRNNLIFIGPDKFVHVLAQS